MNVSFIISIIILVFTVSLFVFNNYNDVVTNEFVFGYDEGFAKPIAERCNLEEITQLRSPLRHVLYCISDNLFENIRVLPFLFSIMIFPLVFILAYQLTKNWLATSLSLLILSTDRIMMYLVSTVSGDPTWCVFLFVSIIMVQAGKKFGGVPFIFSMLHKPLTLLYLPPLIYQTLKVNKYNKFIIIELSFILIFSILSLIFIGQQFVEYDGVVFDYNDIHQILVNFVYIFRHDMFFLLVIFPFSVMGLFLMRKTHTVNSKVILFYILWNIILIFSIPLFTIYDVVDYRMLPLIIFSSIGSGWFMSFLFDKIRNTDVISKHHIIKTSIVLLVLLLLTPLIYYLNYMIGGLPLYNISFPIDVFGWLR